MRVTCSRAVAADGSDVARERDAVSIVCVKGLNVFRRIIAIWSIDLGYESFWSTITL